MQVEKLARTAHGILDGERAGKSEVRPERRKAFSKAASALEKWANRYLDKATVRYLRAQCEAGLWREYADDKGEATQRYSQCEKHPAFKDKTAVLAGRRIDQLVAERKSAIEKADAAAKKLNEATKEETEQKRLGSIATGIAPPKGFKERIAATAAKKANATADMEAFNAGPKDTAAAASRDYAALAKP
jgi:hypothetical protein